MKSNPFQQKNAHKRLSFNHLKERLIHFYGTAMKLNFLFMARHFLDGKGREIGAEYSDEELAEKRRREEEAGNKLTVFIFLGFLAVLAVVLIEEAIKQSNDVSIPIPSSSSGSSNSNSSVNYEDVSSNNYSGSSNSGSSSSYEDASSSGDYVEDYVDVPDVDDIDEY